MNEDEKSALFLQLVLGLQSSAWMFMGKVMNPMTQKVDKNLDQAKITIDTLDVLREKTKGNLTNDEQKLFDELMHQLHVNFLDVSKVAAFPSQPLQERVRQSVHQGFF